MFEIRLPTFHSNGFLRLNNFNLYNMREILFKAKRVDGKGWVKGVPVYTFDVEYNSQGYDDVPERKHYILNEKDNLIEVIPETVSQFTGLVDKNGSKIFECDNIIHCSKSNIKGVVSFFEGSFIVGVAITSNALINFNTPKNLHIIGNIHD